MSPNALTLSQLKDILHYDPLTGVFTWRIKTCRKVVPGAVAGYARPDGYVVIRVNKQRYRASRLAWWFVKGQEPLGDIDHIDGNPQNNSFSNLRDVSTAENIQNQKSAHTRNKSGGLLGVSKEHTCRRWRARICVHGKHILIGRFDTPEEAHQAYVEAKRKHHTTCTI
jgi:hypothetical protein